LEVINVLMIGFNLSSLLGICLIIFSVGLILVPHRRHKGDFILVAMIGLTGGILFFQGWRQDPILQFGQLILGTTTVFYFVQDIKER